MRPTAPSNRQTRQRFLNPRLPFVKAVSSLFPNVCYRSPLVGAKLKCPVGEPILSDALEMPVALGRTGLPAGAAPAEVLLGASGLSGSLGLNSGSDRLVSCRAQPERRQ